EPFEELKKVAIRHSEDQWFRIAVLAASPDRALDWLQALTPLEASPGKEDLVRRAASVLGARGQDREITALLTLIRQGRGWWQAPGLEGVADGLRQGSGRRARLPAAQPILLGLVAQGPTPVGRAALRAAASLDLSPSPQLRNLIQGATPKAGLPEDQL